MKRDMRKPRVFYLAWQVPSVTSGAMLAMHRHFIQHDDFELFVASDMPFSEPGIPSFRIDTPPLLQRLRNTRFARAVRQYEMLLRPLLLQTRLRRCAVQFQPDIIFTIPDNSWSWTAFLLAQRLRLPLVANFQDWWPRCMFNYAFNEPYPMTRYVLERRFRRTYRDSALAFCTSPGMQAFLGDHDNSHVLFPIGAPRASIVAAGPAPARTGGRFRILYAGTPHSSYGQLLRALVRELRREPALQLEIYGTAPDWPAAELAALQADGTFRGFLPFEKLVSEMQSADAFLSIMSFDARLRVMMETSFTTKILDYCLFGKPIVVWGPGYSSIVRLAEETHAMMAVTEPDGAAAARALAGLAAQPERARALGARALGLSRTCFDHETIHGIFASNLRRVAGLPAQP
jgi:glycosyltransferase involved in cell wall biosynthesis